MAKIPFTLDAWLEDKSQKVETRDGRSARIICTDAKADDGACVIALITDDGGEEAYQFFPDGRAFSSKSSIEDCADLFIVTPEEELSEFENAIKDLVLDIDEGELRKLGVFEEENLGAWAVKKASELLALAREQFIKDGYVIEKKAFHDAVEKIDDKHKAEMSVEYSLHCKVENGTRHAVMNWEEFQKVAQHFINCGEAEALKKFEGKYKQSWFNEGKIAGRYEGLSEYEKYQQGVHDGKEEALKDLPRWKVSRAMRSTMPHIMWGDNGMILYKDGFEISIPDLEKLPKED